MTHLAWINLAWINLVRIETLDRQIESKRSAPHHYDLDNNANRTRRRKCTHPAYPNK